MHIRCQAHLNSNYFCLFYSSKLLNELYPNNFRYTTRFVIESKMIFLHWYVFSWLNITHGSEFFLCMLTRNACQIYREREGEKVDRVLLNNTMQIFVGIGQGQMSFYENDLEAAVLNSTTNYYRNMARNHITEDSFPDYMIMVMFMKSFNHLQLQSCTSVKH